MTEGAGGLDGAIDSAFEPERALEHVEGDSDLLASAARSFLRENATRMDEMREAVHQGDAERVQRLAHGLCGAACNFVAAHAEHCTRALEEAAAQRDTAAGHGVGDTVLRAACLRLQTGLRDLESLLKAADRALSEAKRRS